MRTESYVQKVTPAGLGLSDGIYSGFSLRVADVTSGYFSGEGSCCPYFLYLFMFIICI